MRTGNQGAKWDILHIDGRPHPKFPPPPLYESFFEKAKKDPQVQKIIDGREYKVVGMRLIEEREDAVSMVEVEGEHHEIVFDLKTEIVESVAEI